MQDNSPDTPQTRTQYASYSPDMWHDPSNEKFHGSDSTGKDFQFDRPLIDFVLALVPRDDLPWTPIPLRTRFWVTYICVLVAGAISLEVALHYSHKKGGTTSILWINKITRFLIFMQGG
jgi:hypothetical protein